VADARHRRRALERISSSARHFPHATWGEARIGSGGDSGLRGARGDGDWPHDCHRARGAVMKSLKEATTFAVGMPLALLGVAAATIALALNRLGVSVVERVARR
jgi:hypothetical protein